MRLTDLAKHCKALIQKYPEHKAEIVEIYYEAEDEAESGSEDHEVDMAFSDLRELENRIQKVGA